MSDAFTEGTLFVKVTVGKAEHPNFPRTGLDSLVKIIIHVTANLLLCDDIAYLLLQFELKKILFLVLNFNICKFIFVAYKYLNIGLNVHLKN